MNGTPFSAAWNAACSAGQVASFMRIEPSRIAAVKRGASAELAEADRGCFQRLDAARADQQVGLQGRGRQRDQVQPLHAAADQRAGRRHRHAGAFARHRQHAAVGDGRERVVEVAGDGRHGADSIDGCEARQVGIGAILPTLEMGQELENKGLMPTLKDKLATDRFVITAEIAPPVSCDAADLIAKAAPLKGLADAVNVTDGAGARAHLSPVAAAAILLQSGIEPILQLTCRDRNRIALQSELMGAAALGIRNLLLLKGDDPKQGDQPDAKPVFDYDTAALTAVAVAMRDKGELPTGKKVAGKADFFIAAADVPIDPPAGWEPKSLKAKIAAGCEFVQTQFCMDAGVVRRYMARLAEHGVKRAVPDRHFAAAVGQVGALDAREAVRHDHSRRDGRAAGGRDRSGRRGPQALHRSDARACHHSGRRRRAHHGARQRGARSPMSSRTRRD